MFDEPQVSDGAGFDRAVRKAMADPDLSPTEQNAHWRWDDRTDDPEVEEVPGWMRASSEAVALVVENLLWILLRWRRLIARVRGLAPWLTAVVSEGARGGERACGAALPLRRIWPTPC